MSDSEERMDDDYDESGNEEEEDEDEEDVEEGYIISSLDPEAGGTQPKFAEEEFRYDILTGDQVVELMQEIIRDVNTIVQVHHKIVYFSALD